VGITPCNKSVSARWRDDNAVTVSWTTARSGPRDLPSSNVVVSRSCVRMTSLLLRSVHRRVGTPGSAWRLEDDVVGRAGWTKATGSRCCGPVGLQLEATPCRGTRPPSSTRGCRAAAPGEEAAGGEEAAAPGEEAAASAEDLGARRSAPCWAPMSTRTHALCWARSRRRRRRRWSAWTAAGPCWAP
jgi:hypothetical protein